MDKLGRSYKLLVARIDGSFQEFSLPYSIEFAVDRNNYSSPNTATISILNLSQESRNQLRKDSLDIDVSRRVILKVGYGDRLSTIFDGTLDRCYSVRQGVNFVTHLECRDNGYIYTNIYVKVDYSDNATKKSVVENIVSQIESRGIERGIIGKIEGSFPRGGSREGLALELLREITGDTCYVDSNKIYVISDGEAIIGEYGEISSSTGLIGTPILENAFVKCEIVLEPRLLICQKVKLITTTATNSADPTYHFAVANFNGDYKIGGIKHSGTISATTAGTATTMVTLFGDFINTTYKGFTT